MREKSSELRELQERAYGPNPTRLTTDEAMRLNLLQSGGRGATKHSTDQEVLEERSVSSRTIKAQGISPRRPIPILSMLSAAAVLVFVAAVGGYVMGVNHRGGDSSQEADESGRVVIRIDDGNWVAFDSGNCAIAISPSDGSITGVNCVVNDPSPP